MDFWTWISNPVVLRDGIYGAITIFVIISIIRGWLVTGPEHKRALDEVLWLREANRKSEEVRALLNQENFKLLESIRIADKFYASVLRTTEPDSSATEPR